MAPRNPRKEPKYLPTAPVLPIVTLSKQDAARRQLETAIDLLTAGGDTVAVHVLVSSAHDVIEGVAKSRKILTGFEANVSRYPKQLQTAYRNTIKRPYNFMKHGGREEELDDFVPMATPFYVVLVHGTYCQVFGEKLRNSDDLMDWYKEFEKTLPPPTPAHGMAVEG